MASGLQHAVGEPIIRGTVAAGSMGVGYLAYVEYMTGIVALLSAMAGLTLSVLLSIKTYGAIMAARAEKKKRPEGE